MNLPAKVCLGAGAFLAMSGGLLALTGFALGAQTHLNLPFGGGSAAAAETPVNTGAPGEEVWTELVPFSSVQLDVPLGDVSVLPGAEYHISISGARADTIDYQLDGDTLVVTGADAGSVEFFASGDQASVIIEVPEGVYLETVDLHTALGQVDVSGVTAGSLTVAAELGDVYLDNVMAADADVTLSMGTLTGYSLTTTASLTVENDMGDVYLGGDFQGNTDITLSMGSLDFTTMQTLDTYSMDLSVTMGDLYLNGDHQYGSVRREGGPNQLKIANSMGDADVYFG